MTVLFATLDNYTNSETISGYAAPGTTVRLVDSNGVVVGTTSTVGTDYTWSLALDAGHLFTTSGQVQSFQPIDIDSLGQPDPYPLSARSVTYTTIAPQITITSAGGATISGHQHISGIVDDTVGSAPMFTTGVGLILSEGAHQLAFVSIGTNGQWSADVDLTGAGTHIVTARASDEAGNTGQASVSYLLTPPSIAITSVGNQGSVAFADAQAGFTISGSTNAEDNQTVTIAVDGTRETTKAIGGAWSITWPSYLAHYLLAGDHTVTADVTSAAGVGAVEAHATLTVTSPTPTVTIDPIGHDGSLSLAEAHAGFQISGATNAEDGQRVTIYVDGWTVTAIASGNTWTATYPGYMAQALWAGSHTVKADVTSAAGVAAAEAHVALTLTNPMPTVVINPIGHDGSLSLAEAHAGFQISGATSAEDGQRVSVYVDGAVVSAIASGNTWTAAYPGYMAQALGAGSHTVRADVINAAGLRAPEASESFTLDSSAHAVFRFYDTVTNDHFYTTDPNEKTAILNTLKTFSYEGAAWGTPDKGVGTVDVFRFFDTVTKTHFLTQDAAERDMILKDLPKLTYEGVAFEAYAQSGGEGTFALERFYNSNSKVHTYAADASEIALIKSGAVGQGWIDEGAAFVVHSPDHDLLT